MTDPANLDTALAENARYVDAALTLRLERLQAPPRLKSAMGHALLAGGKRLRPFLVIEGANLFGVGRDAALPLAEALECLHTYSLVHDDLPAMDDDDVRRGQPTVHRAFDEATAILAGDALLTLAFGILANPDTHADAEVRTELVAELAEAAGAMGMVGGQMLDLAFETEAPSGEEIVEMQAMKTGTLFRFAARAGGLIGGASEAELTCLDAYASALGRTFQITDDLLDVKGSAEAMGKAAGKDAGRGKATLVGQMGIDAAEAEAVRLIDLSKAALEPFGAAGGLLCALSESLIRRHR